MDGTTQDRGTIEISVRVTQYDQDGEGKRISYRRMTLTPTHAAVIESIRGPIAQWVVDAAEIDAENCIDGVSLVG